MSNLIHVTFYRLVISLLICYRAHPFHFKRWIKALKAEMSFLTMPLR